MSNSFATTAQLTCSDCGQSFQADLWLLVDSAERPDLLELARNGTLHDIDCPHCDQTNRVNAPTLLYRPELLTNGLSDTPLIFLSADGLDAAREAEQARRLLGMLAASLGTDWQDGWLHDAPGLPVDFFLAGDSVAPFSPSTALSPSAAAGGGLGRGDEIPNELRPLLEFMAALPEDQRDALTHIFAQASSPEDALASLESQPALRDAVADFLGDSGSFRTPSHFESDRRVAQEAEASYRSGGGLASLHRAADAWNRILDHPTFVTTDPRFRLAVWNDAAIVFARRHSAQGRMGDLDRALELWQAAVAETPAGSPDRPMFLSNLGNGLSARFARNGRMQDLEEAIRVYEAAVAETPAGSPDRPSRLNNLGNGLRARFARSGRVADLEEAIRVHEAAVAETPAGSPDRPGYLNNLGTGLSDRFARSGRVADLEEAIRVYEAAVAETPAGSPDRPGYLNNLGTGLSDRFARSGRVADLEEAIRVYEAAVAETPAGSPDRPSRLNNLGTGLSDRFARSGRVADLEEATNAYRAACELGVLTAPEGSLRAGRNWARWAVTRPAPNFVDAAQAGAFALDSVDALFGVQLERSAQESFLKEAQGIHTTTAYALARQALDDASSFLFQQAVETVERGQARLLAQALEENRADLDRLEAVEQDQLYADYQANLAQRSALLAQLEAAPDSAVRSALNGQLRANKDERDGLVKRIQAVPGFEDFLVRPSFARIAAALTPRPPLSPAGEGESEPHPSPPHFGEGADARASDDASSATRASISPSPGTGEVGRGSFLVYLLASPAGGLALIVHREDGAEPATVTPVWLDGLTEEWLRALVYGPAEGSALGGYLGAYSRSRSDPQGWLNTLDNTCRQLWDVAMGPLAEALAALDSRSPDQTQSAHHQPAQSSIPVTLIPTGLLGLLPLQAAFTDRSNAGGDALPNSAFAVPRSAFSTRRYFLDGFAVNYATSAIALGHSQERVLQATSERILAVTEPWPVGEVRLPNARPQAIAIANLFPLSSQLEGHQATRSALLDRLPDTDVFHFFGHGNTDWGNPLESTLWCADNERLTVRDLLAQRLPGARLAVLSACETGIAGQQLPDETVNLSSALVQAGFAGVVASLWSVYEISTAMLIVRFYHYWRVDGLAPTDALRSAQLWLRDTTNREKADFFGQFVPGLQTEIAGQLGSEFFEDLYDREEGLDAYSFAHPMHWAAFTLTGV